MAEGEVIVKLSETLPYRMANYFWVNQSGHQPNGFTPPDW